MNMLDAALDAPRPSRLSRAPMALFSIVMGLGGLAIAWRRAHLVLGAPALVGESLMALAALLWIAIAVVQVLRVARFPGVLVAEFRSPAAAVLVPTFTVATALLAAGLAPYSKEAASSLWIFAACTHLILAFTLVRRWFAERRDVDEASPSWFIPVVGTLTMPIVGVPLGHVEASWFLFSVGSVFWVILAPVMTWRLFFAAPLPEAAAPSLFILLAPPSIGALATLALTDGAASPLTHVLFGFSIFIAALVASLLRRVLRTHFSISWWALAFPSAAFATLSLAYFGLIPGTVTCVIAVAALAASSLLVVTVTMLTIRALAAGTLIPS